MENKVTISGPVNIVRLKGNLFGIDKVIYVFFDIHADCEMETKCENIFSEDIKKYFARQFKNATGKTLDFFLEVNPSSIFYKNNYRNIYLNELRELMAHAFAYNPEENKVYRSVIFPQVRLHYIDIRDFMFNQITYFQYNHVYNIYMNIKQSRPSFHQLEYFRSQILIFSKNIMYIMNIFFPQQNQQKTGGRSRKIGVEKPTMDDYRENIENFTDKIMNRYKHQEVRNVILELLDNDLFRCLDTIEKTLQLILNMWDHAIDLLSIDRHTYNPKHVDDLEFVRYSVYGPNDMEIYTILSNVYPLITNVGVLSASASAVIVDAYFLRRFLDKDYITNAISYTGANHSTRYIYILCKYFGFKITHASYSKYDISELNEKVANTNFGEKFFALFYPPELYQCSDISDFPDKFN